MILEDPVVLSNGTHSRPMSSTKFDEGEPLKSIDSVKIFGSTYDRKENEMAHLQANENRPTVS